MSANSTSVPNEQIFIGVVFTGLAFVDVLLYLPCLIVIRTDAELKIHSCFQFMFHLGLADFINIVGQAVCGVWTILGTQIPYWANKFFGSFMSGGWYAYITLLHLIALNRFVEICCSPYYKDKLFSGRAAWLACCWCLAGAWTCLMLSPDTGFIYHPSIQTWYFDMNRAWSSDILNLNWMLDIILLKASIVWYLAIVISIRFMTSGLGVPATEPQTNMREKERRILRQAVLIGLYTFVWAQYWNVAGWLFAKGFSYAFALGNFFWVTNSAVNPIVYLTMNKQINRKVKEMLGIKTGNQVAQAPKDQAPKTASQRGTKHN